MILKFIPYIIYCLFIWFIAYYLRDQIGDMMYSLGFVTGFIGYIVLEHTISF